MLKLVGSPNICSGSFGDERHGFGIVTVSRPGYGRTPTSEVLKTSDGQADLLVALMKHLGCDKFPVMVGSGGGVIGLRLALKYPDVIQALCM